MTFTDTFAAVFIVAIWLVGLLVDVYLIRKGGEPNSISWRTTYWSMRYPIIPLMLGFSTGLLLGHLYWPNHAFCQ